jgi:hypothetical protein
MSVLIERIGHSGRLGVLVAAFLAVAPTLVSAKDTINVVVDQAQVMKLPEGVVTLVVGNPLIADVSIQSGGMIVVTGKGYGKTNVMALDRVGTLLEDKDIVVRGSSDSVVVYRGTERESYSCTPKCERRITLGDSADFFNATISQSGTRTGQAQAGQAK